MNRDHAQTQSTMRHQWQSQVETQLHRRWLLLARGIWIALVILTLAIFFASLPVCVALLQTICTGTYGISCAYQQLTSGQVGVLKGMGLSPGDYAAYTVAFALASVVMCLVVSMLIVWRRSDDQMALLVALMLVTLGPIIVTNTVSESSSPWQLPNACLSFLAIALLVLVFLLFPTGQFVPRWTRWTLVVFLVVLVPYTFFPNTSFTLNTHADWVGYLMFLGELAIVVIVQLYRYRHVSSPIERQQTKWVVFGVAIPVTVFLGATMPSLIFPVLAEPSSLFPVVLNVVGTFLLLILPLSFGFAMLRSRLWDIDVIINRTLVYGTLTALLALVYVGLIVALQFLLRGMISQDNGVAIVLSTLITAALFQPLRQRIQGIIDRRFYRSKYDAAKTLAAFRTTLHQEVDLEQLREHLLAVVQETMQPTHVSLWLRLPEPDRKHTACLE